MMTHYFTVPGLGNSGPDHWQTFFERSNDNFIRINQTDWDEPNCKDWIETIDQTISAYDLSTVVLIGHSLGCATIAHWATQYNKKIKAALLIAPSDLEAPQYTFKTAGFSPMPRKKINFKTLIVASSNDPWVSLDRAKYFADTWGSELINIGDAGHINASSGYGEWEEGLSILNRL